MKIIGPFSQIITLEGLPNKGALKDDALQIIKNGGCLIEHGEIVKLAEFETLCKDYPQSEVEEIECEMVLIPGFVDCHTHSCFAGSRAMDFAERNAGTSYLDIAGKGGGIWSTVQNTRAANFETLKKSTESRVNKFLQEGITTIEIKSGYGLSVEEELKMLEVIKNIDTKSTVISTCLAAHLKPKDFNGTQNEYLKYISDDLLPKINHLASRVDIFTEKSAFGIEESREYLEVAKKYGFDITVHADQFSSGSALMAVQVGAASADHLEVINDVDIAVLAQSNTVAVALPGASIGLGEPFTPARKLLDQGACLAIGSDYNPGSAPMGKLLTQASILATFQKLRTAEVLAALTFRAAKAININAGRISKGYKADMQAYACNDYREILYQQGSLMPSIVWKNGEKI